MRSRRRVVITGLGAVTSAGADVASFRNALESARSGIRAVDLFDTRKYPVHIAAQLPVDPADVAPLPGGIDFPSDRPPGRAAHIALAAALEAWSDAGFKTAVERAGCVASCGSGSIFETEQVLFGASDASYGFNPWEIGEAIASVIPCASRPLNIVSACSSGSVAMALAAQRIREGLWDVALAGAGDTLSRLCFGGFNVLRAMDTAPCRPFDKERSGMTLGEGAGAIVLESWEHAIRRQADIYAEIIGLAIGLDAYHITAPDPSGAPWALTIQKALTDAEIGPEDVDYINAHGTATPLNDEAEAAAVRTVFGKRSESLPISSIKPIIGHCQFAAGAIEVIATVLSIMYDFMPPTLYTRRVDPRFKLEVILDRAVKRCVRTALSQSFGFGGTSCVIVLRRYEDD